LTILTSSIDQVIAMLGPGYHLAHSSERESDGQGITSGQGAGSRAICRHILSPRGPAATWAALTRPFAGLVTRHCSRAAKLRRPSAPRMTSSPFILSRALGAVVLLIVSVMDVSTTLWWIGPPRRGAADSDLRTAQVQYCGRAARVRRRARQSAHWVEPPFDYSVRSPDPAGFPAKRLTLTWRHAA
jgi:hypothetical protein